MKESERNASLLAQSILFTLKYFDGVQGLTKEEAYEHWIQHIVGATVLFQRCACDPVGGNSNFERIFNAGIEERRTILREILTRTKEIHNKPETTVTPITGTFIDALSMELAMVENALVYGDVEKMGFKIQEMDFFQSTAKTLHDFFVRQLNARENMTAKSKAAYLGNAMKSMIISSLFPIFVNQDKFNALDVVKSIIRLLEMIIKTVDLELKSGHYGVFREDVK